MRLTVPQAIKLNQCVYEFISSLQQSKDLGAVVYSYVGCALHLSVWLGVEWELQSSICLHIVKCVPCHRVVLMEKRSITFPQRDITTNHF